MNAMSDTGLETRLDAGVQSRHTRGEAADGPADAGGVSTSDVASRLIPWRWWWLPALTELDRRLFGSSAWTLEQFYSELAAPGRWLRLLRGEGPGPIQREARSVAASEPDARAESPPLRTLGYVDVAIAGRDADLMTIGLDPSVRGRGWGRLLLDAAMTAAARAGATTMFLDVRADNPAAELYRRAGFTQLQRRRDYYGAGVDALVMSRRLPDPASEDLP